LWKKKIGQRKKKRHQSITRIRKTDFFAKRRKLSEKDSLLGRGGVSSFRRRWEERPGGERKSQHLHSNRGEKTIMVASEEKKGDLHVGFDWKELTHGARRIEEEREGEDHEGEYDGRKVNRE